MKRLRRTQFDINKPFFARKTVKFGDRRFPQGTEIPWTEIEGLTESKMYQLWGSRFVECGVPDGVERSSGDGDTTFKASKGAKATKKKTGGRRRSASTVPPVHMD